MIFRIYTLSSSRNPDDVRYIGQTIKLFKSFGARLTNYTEGGDAPMLNRKHSPEVITKIASAVTGKKRRPASEERKQKIKESLLKYYETNPTRKPMLGKKHSQETKDKLSKLRKVLKRKPKSKS